MADDLDNTESAPGGDTLAAQIAMTGSASAEAREYLRKQSHIADLTIDTLQKKDEFELSHLRFRRFSDYARFALEVAGFLVVLLVVCGLGSMVWNASRERRNSRRTASRSSFAKSAKKRTRRQAAGSPSIEPIKCMAQKSLPSNSSP